MCSTLQARINQGREARLADLQRSVHKAQIQETNTEERRALRGLAALEGTTRNTQLGNCSGPLFTTRPECRHPYGP